MTGFIGLFDTVREYTLQFTMATITSVHNNVFTAVACYRLPTADVSLPLGSRNVPGLSYQLLTTTEPSSPLTHSLTN
jgi:hypothetical protein